MLAAQIDAAKVSAAAERMALALRTPISGALRDLDVAFSRSANGVFGGSAALVNAPAAGNTYQLSFPNYVGDKQELMSVVRQELYRTQKSNGNLGFT